jgi:uncharacterized protein (TIGR03435 family)
MIGNAGFIVLMSPAIFGQSFEVASVKLHPGDATEIGITTSGPRFRASAETVVGLVTYAYNLKYTEIVSAGPKLALDDAFYDITAKAEGDAAPAPAAFRKMLQSLLVDRFKLQIHYEKRETPVFALVLGKNGPKFKESAPDSVVSLRHPVEGRNQGMMFSKATMADLVLDLPLFTGRRVVDKTGLTGTYDIKFEATPSSRMNRDPEPGDISVFDAVQQQLGLKLEAQKAMVDVLVVDHVEKPSGN